MELPIIQRLKKELADLQHELSHKLPRELEEARAHGDLSENAEYEAAKARQEIVQARIKQIGGRIRELSMYTVASIPEGVAAYGSRVTVEDLEEGEEIIYNLVFPEEAEVSRKHFVELRELRDALEKEFQVKLPQLSMGMTNDYIVAVEEGATLVRVGTAIFGERRRPKPRSSGLQTDD